MSRGQTFCRLPYIWDIGDLSGTEGVHYDLLQFTTAYDLSNLSGNQLNISINDTNSYIGPNGGTAGTAYKIAQNVTNFNEDYFNLISNLLNTVWTISESGGSLYLTYTVVPEPSTYFMCGMVLILVGYRFWNKRGHRYDAEQ
jgi:hypothetical protein